MTIKLIKLFEYHWHDELKFDLGLNVESAVRVELLSFLGFFLSFFLI